MAWLLSTLSSWLPDLWLLPAIAAAGLWLYGYICPARITAEIVRVGALVLVGSAVYLWCWSDATAACEARVEAAAAAEAARQQQIVGDALTQARAEGRAAMDAAAEARAGLEAAIARLDRETDPSRPACALSRRYGRALP